MSLCVPGAAEVKVDSSLVCEKYKRVIFVFFISQSRLD